MKTFLFSIDFEEFAVADPGRSFRCTAMSDLLNSYLQLLGRHEMRATFFVVGSVARKYPDLIRRIVDYGHEVGCHTNTHNALDQLTPDTFRANLERNIESLTACGATSVMGFRAPIFSLTNETQWAYAVLEAAGIRYSSSVLAAKNPLYGWPEFGTGIRSVGGVTEVPVTLYQFGPLRVPIFGGTYFRLAPAALVKSAMRTCPDDRPLVGFFHPYDIDTHQDWVMNAGVNGNLFLNHLLYVGRGSVLRRLEAMLNDGVQIRTYWEYLSSHNGHAT